MPQQPNNIVVRDYTTRAIYESNATNREQTYVEAANRTQTRITELDADVARKAQARITAARR